MSLNQIQELANINYDEFETLENVQKEDLLMTILKKQPQERTKNELKIIMLATKNLDFFKPQFTKKSKHDMYMKLCKCMRIEVTKKLDIVINYGDPPDKFYIMLSGTVGIMIPKPPDQMKQLSKQHGKRIALRQLKKEEYYQDDLNMAKYFNNPKVFHPYSRFLMFTMPATFAKGYMFGHLGILTGQPRKASIICMTDCVFATLTTKEYLDIKGQDDTKRLNRRIEFFEKNLIPDFEKSVIIKVQENFDKEKYAYKQSIFIEGEDVKHQYQIKSGEISIKKFIYPLNKEPLSPKSKAIFQDKKKNIQRHHTISTVSEGSFQAIDSYFTPNCKHKYSCIVTTDSATVFQIPKGPFTQLQHDYPKIKTTIMRSVKIRNITRDDRIELVKGIRYQSKGQHKTAITQLSQIFNEENQGLNLSLNKTTVDSVKGKRSSSQPNTKNKSFDNSQVAFTDRIKGIDMYQKLVEQNEENLIQLQLSTMYLSGNIGMNRGKPKDILDDDGLNIGDAPYDEEIGGDPKTSLNVNFNKKENRKKKGGDWIKKMKDTGFRHTNYRVNVLDKGIKTQNNLRNVIRKNREGLYITKYSFGIIDNLDVKQKKIMKTEEKNKHHKKKVRSLSRSSFTNKTSQVASSSIGLENSLAGNLNKDNNNAYQEVEPDVIEANFTNGKNLESTRYNMTAPIKGQQIPSFRIDIKLGDKARNLKRIKNLLQPMGQQNHLSSFDDALDTGMNFNKDKITSHLNKNPFEYGTIKKYAINRTQDAFNVADNSLVRNINFDIKPVFFMSKKSFGGMNKNKTEEKTNTKDVFY